MDNLFDSVLGLRKLLMKYYNEETEGPVVDARKVKLLNDALAHVDAVYDYLKEYWAVR